MELEPIQGIIQLYCRALSGAAIDIFDTNEIEHPHTGWVDENVASTDGSKVFLPSEVDRYDEAADNFAWYKVIATHQVAHVEFGSFSFAFSLPATRFSDRRLTHPEAINLGVPKARPEGEMRAAQTYTDIGRFFRLFAQPRLAVDLFTILEDARLDYRLNIEYPGNRAAARRVQAEALSLRPCLRTMTVQTALVELIIHMSLEQFAPLSVPCGYDDVAVMLARIVHRLCAASSTVEDAAEAALRAYSLIACLTNDDVEDWLTVDLADLDDFSEADYRELLEILQARRADAEANAAEPPYETPEPVAFRGEFKPEMVQLMNELQMGPNAPEELQDLTQEQLEQLLQESAEFNLAPDQDEMSERIPEIAAHLMQQVIMPMADANSGADPESSLPDDDPIAVLPPLAPGSYAYDEWDYAAAAYKRRWCIVKEQVLEEGDASAYDTAVQNNAALLRHIKHQFELIMPELYRKTYRLVDGEDMDLNAALEAWADIRMKLPPDDKIYWRRHRIQRDVAVVFLLDMSASTAEPISPDSKPEMSRLESARNAYNEWLQNREATRSRPLPRRIIDIEKESAALLIQVLESIGDTYGIYGFSGYGRDNVEYFVIKDIAERFNSRVKRRIDNIVPLHATRMGPAIRHTTTKLASQSAATKLLILFSDGRPQDRGYSRPGAQHDYAVHDTRMALQEAKDSGITPFCLTIDKTGKDYLQAMCGDMGYEVLDNIALLPERLPMLYRSLTMRVS